MDQAVKLSATIVVGAAGSVPMLISAVDRATATPTPTEMPSRAIRMPPRTWAPSSWAIGLVPKSLGSSSRWLSDVART